MKQISFFPEPKYNPKYPADGTLAFKALTLMLGGARLSHPQFEAHTGSWRLAAHVYNLKKLGWPVRVDDMEFGEEDENQRQRHFGIYYLPEELLEFMRGEDTHRLTHR